MGLLLSKPPESSSYQGPALRTPLSDISGPFGHWDGSGCASFEMNYLDCQEAYGQIKGKEKCKLYWQDFLECAQKWKQVKRIEAMRDERDRQWVKGLIGMGPCVPLFAEPPQMDSYSPDPMDNTN